ncbi:MAG: hypothetical protein KDC48_08165 [Planctomycetes bacterium]|nr:hypothetical protein [Planctomycetota bacterium]
MNLAAPRSWRWLVPFGLGAVALCVGWWQTRFLCDDAFIAFRYVGNAHDGHGLVWNTAPFAPVEGYSCFLWVLVLWGVWSISGIAPPDSANALALLCSLGTLLLLSRRLLRPREDGGGEPASVSLAAIAVLGAATNATFVTWSSSGLETAMFGLFAVGWTLAATDVHRESGRRPWLAVATWAALAQLTRPDGALLILATLVLAAHAWATRRARLGALLVGLTPLFAPGAHLLWRRWFYGEWLPNTYYAKVVAAWPESGLRYLYCFAVEHGVWLWLLLIVLWVLVAAVRGASLRALFGRGFGAVVVVGTWSGYVGYYGMVVGGDHFAWRPFAHLLPLMFLSTCWLASAIGWRTRTALPLLAVFAVLANGFGWWFERKIEGREKDGFVRASTRLPAPLAGWFSTYDRCRAWLRLHYVALPRGLHAVTSRDLLRLLPERRAGQVAGLGRGERGVYRTVAAGVVSWALADIAIIDAVGLNDWIVARHPGEPPTAPFDPQLLLPAFDTLDGDRDGRLGGAEIARFAPLANLDATGVLVSPACWAELLLALCDRNGDGLDRAEFAAAIVALQDQRHMAHERTPPPGYLQALRPNVALIDGAFRADPAIAPLTDAEVVAIERRFRDQVRK